MSGFAKTKRDLALKMGVDPYTRNDVFQRELSKVAWPAFLGKMTVNLGMAAVTGGVGTALSVANWTSTLQDSLRDKSATDLRLMNRKLLVDSMGVSSAVADTFLDNPAISPTTQTITVASLAQLGNIPGQAEFIRQAATSENEHDALSYQLSVQIMAKLNEKAPVARITHLQGLTLCQTNDGTVVVPIQWDYVSWTPGVAQFVTALKAQKFASPATAFTVMINGAASPMATEALSVVLFVLFRPSPSHTFASTSFGYSLCLCFTAGLRGRTSYKTRHLCVRAKASFLGYRMGQSRISGLAINVHTSIGDAYRIDNKPRTRRLIKTVFERSSKVGIELSRQVVTVII
ncbi:MAG: hypothetical protein EOO38_24525 [Cytophagaceae bacterium]|nr:MAG: hypothetical protein EOO38_24525 [Cytophagaceae bacterium]